MPWNGSGTFARENGATGWADDEALNIGIESGLHDTHDTDLAAGINACLAKNGENAATGNLPMGGFKHTNVAVASARTEYARHSQIQDNAIQYAGTSGGAANVYTLTLSPAISAYTAGMRFAFRANHSNTGFTTNSTLNINGVGAKDIRRFRNNYSGSVGLLPGDIQSGNIVEVIYNATDDDFFILNPTPQWNDIAATISMGGSGVSVTLDSVNRARMLCHADKSQTEFDLDLTFTTDSGSGASIYAVIGTTVTLTTNTKVFAGAGGTVTTLAAMVQDSTDAPAVAIMSGGGTSISVVKAANWGYGGSRKAYVRGSINSNA